MELEAAFFFLVIYGRRVIKDPLLQTKSLQFFKAQHRCLLSRNPDSEIIPTSSHWALSILDLCLSGSWQVVPGFLEKLSSFLH